MLDILFQLKQHKVIAESDYYFAGLIGEKQQAFGYSAVVQHLAVLLAALCSYSHRQGNTCLYLEAEAEYNPFNLAYRTFADGRNYLSEIKAKINHLPITRWQSELARHIAFTDNPAQRTAPLAFQYNALYFYRVWQDEYRVAAYLKSAVENPDVFYRDIPPQQIRSVLNRYFSARQDGGQDWQKIAVAMALRGRFCLISGGPGTGKTYTVARLLAAAQELRLIRKQPFLRIALAAPTGKAAARLTESIGYALNGMALSQTLTDAVPKESMTIHRLLGVRLFEDSVKFDRRNPLPFDLLVIDEASMIDLSMMAKLLQALKPQSKLVLLGDKDQLASVEAGALIGELGRFIADGFSVSLSDYLAQSAQQNVQPVLSGNPIRDYLCELRESRRFHQDSGIGALAKAVNSSEKNCWALFERYEDIDCWVFPETAKPTRNMPESEEQRALQAGCLAQVLKSAVEKYAVYLQTLQLSIEQGLPLDNQNLQRIFRQFNSIRFLTALRDGPFGLENLNRSIAEKLRRHGLLHFKQPRDWYSGKPIMINRNDSAVGLFNGDIGLYLGDGKVWFETGKGYRSVSVSRIPHHEPAFAMTVHKSQGSEFEHTFLVLPLQSAPVLSKELLYTAITRAKKRLTVFSSKSIWQSAVGNPIKRQSGLGKLLSINNPS